MAWNQSVKHLLASSSADTTVRLWDLNEAKCLRTYSHHDAPVENIEWNSEMASVLLTGAHDKSCAVFDTRAADAVARWGFDSDVECTSWHPHATSCFLAGTSGGNIYCCDTRNPGEVLFTLSAHEAGVSCLTMSKHVPGLLVTGSSDQKLKIWDIDNHQPAIIHSRDAELGPIYTMNFGPDSPFSMCVGGHVGGVKVVNLAETTAIRRHFGSRHQEGAAFGEQLAKAREEESETRLEMGLPEEDDDAFDESDEEEDWSKIMDDFTKRRARRTRKALRRTQQRHFPRQLPRRRNRRSPRRQARDDASRGVLSSD